MMTQMINSESISNDIVKGGVVIPAYKQGNGVIGFTAEGKQPQGAMKKMALRDVQNQYGAIAQKHHENLGFTAGGSNNDNTVKVCGTKRLTPERPSSSPLYPTSVNSRENEHVVNARRRFDLELGSKANFQSSINNFTSPHSMQFHQLPLETPEKKQTSLKANSKNSIPNNMSPAKRPFNVLPGPNFLGKISSRMQAIHAPSTECNITTDEQSRMERFICLQKYLKECDESDYRKYLDGLHHLSPAELSRHAQELENRLYRLAVEDSNEMNRMKALNVLGKSSITSSVPQYVQQLLPRK